jgi:hypothetical protein
VATSEDPAVPYGPAADDLAAWLPEAAPVVLPTPTSVARLAPGPRRIPTSYRGLALDLKVWVVVTAGVVFFVGVGLASALPAIGAVALTLGAALVVYVRVRRTRLRFSLLKWGEVATVTGYSRVSGIRHDNVTYGNARLPQARGWALDTTSYSGPGRTDDVQYSLAGHTGVVRVGGRGYAGGVVLADPRSPAHALCVSEFGVDLTPDPHGQWPGEVSGGTWLGIGLTLLVEGGLVLAALVAWARVAS